jgi:hypothetical protein
VITFRRRIMVYRRAALPELPAPDPSGEDAGR